MTQKSKIIDKINELPSDLLVDLDICIDNLLQIYSNQQINKFSTGKQLEKLKVKTKLNSKDKQVLTENLEKEWDIVKERQILTHYFIDIIREFQNPQTDPMSVKRRKFDSRTGGFFEDNFMTLLNCYLRSKDDLWTEDNYFQKVELLLNPSIPVPGERNNKQPDILIRDCKTKTSICIIELKKSFTKRSLIKTYDDAFQIWEKLNNDIKFLFVIFSASSENKTRTYKKVENCRVVCYDFKTDQNSGIKEIPVTIVDSIESIFEEIYKIIVKFNK